jgi:hypothetical protein
MSKSPGLSEYISSAFSARPKGMFVSPNWIGIGAFALLGALINPGFLLIGAGLEVAYLFGLSTNPRFQRYVRAQQVSQENESKQVQLSTFVARLTPDARQRFNALQQRCRSIMDFYENQLNIAPSIVDHHSTSLNRFAWIFLQLLLTKGGILRMMQEGSFTAEFRSRIEKEITQLDARIQSDALSPELKKSLESQREILRQRLAVVSEADAKLNYINAELDRIEQQIELLREQAAVSKDSQAIAVRIDDVTSSLGETTEWIKEQQSLFGAVQDVVEEPPQIVGQSSRGILLREST